MSAIAYVNGEFTPHENAKIHIDDRGFQFADGVYEVCLVIDGEYWDFDGHLNRLDRSLGELRIRPPVPRSELEALMGEILVRNNLRNALVYMQVTRGVAPRNHPFPADDTKPTLVITARPFDINASDANAEKGARVITVPDIRWGRVDIKSVSLLANVLAKQAAVEAGALEAWLTRDRKITEGSSSNAWIVDSDGMLRTHPLSNEILGGITRQTLLSCADEAGIPVREDAFTVDEIPSAREAFITSATNLVMPIIAVDDIQIGHGTPGQVTMLLRKAYKMHAKARK